MDPQPPVTKIFKQLQLDGTMWDYHEGEKEVHVFSMARDRFKKLIRKMHTIRGLNRPITRKILTRTNRFRLVSMCDVMLQ